jgi:SAM-dependent methyltransferase
MTDRAQADYHRAARCYSDLSPYYHDWSVRPWPENMRRQGEALAHLLSSLDYSPTARVLDFTAGMGTQSIGLALNGYHPTSMDLSPGQIGRARTEAGTVGVEEYIDWVVGDAVQASDYVTGPFDVAFSFGNSLTLLGSRENILAALTQMRRLLRPGGMLLLSVADYTAKLAERPHVMQSGRVDNSDRKGVWMETAEWIPDTRQYVSSVYFIYTEPENTVHHYPFAALYALADSELRELLREAGFTGYRYYSRQEAPAFSCPLHMAFNPDG